VEVALPFEAGDMLDKYRVMERLLGEQKQEMAARDAGAVERATQERELACAEHDQRRVHNSNS
jgi:hypothetical protein